MPSVDSGREYECYRCGNVGHVSSASSCQARGKTCRLCEGGYHFAKKCKNTNKGEERSSAVGHIDLNQRKGEFIMLEVILQVVMRPVIVTVSTQFAVYSITSELEKAEVIVGCVTVPVIADSGSDSDVINRSLWETLKSKRIVCTSRECRRISCILMLRKHLCTP